MIIMIWILIESLGQYLLIKEILGNFKELSGGLKY